MKRLASIRTLAVFVVGTVLVSCSGTTSSGESATAVASASDTSDPSSGSSALQQMIDAAQQEGAVVWADNGAPERITALQDAFNEHFGLDITVEQVPLRSSEAQTRVLQESAADQVSLDVMNGSGGIMATMFEADANAFIDPIDWVELFGESLPEIQSVVEHVPSDWQGRLLEYSHQSYVVIYNTELVSEDEAPQSWEDLLDPAWQGRRIALDPRGFGLNELFVELGTDETLDLASGLIAQDPLWIEGSPAIAEAIAIGEADLGVTTHLNALTQIEEGAPVALASIPLVVASPQMMMPIAGSPNPNAAILWAAFVTTEGIAILEAQGDPQHRLWPDLDNASTELFQNAGVEPHVIDNPDDFLEAGRMQSEIAQLIQQSGVE